MASGSRLPTGDELESYGRPGRALRAALDAARFDLEGTPAAAVTTDGDGVGVNATIPLLGPAASAEAARQSVGAAQLWTALAQDYRHGFVDIDGRALRYLGETVDDHVHGALHTRRLMLGHGWEIGEFARATGMAGAARTPVR